MKYLSIGDRVLVHIPQEDRVNHGVLMPYHGQEMKIADRKVVGHSTKVYYKLVGAESEYGIPYCFIKDWLIQL